MAEMKNSTTMARLAESEYHMKAMALERGLVIKEQLRKRSIENVAQIAAVQNTMDELVAFLGYTPKDDEPLSGGAILGALHDH